MDNAILNSELIAIQAGNIIVIAFNYDGPVIGNILVKVVFQAS